MWEDAYGDSEWGTNPHRVGGSDLSVVLTSADLSGADLSGAGLLVGTVSFINFSVFCRFFKGKV